MNRHRRGAGVLHHSREERSIAIAIAPSRTHFYRDRNLDGLRHRTDDVARRAPDRASDCTRRCASRSSAPGSPCSRRRCRRPSPRQSARRQPSCRDRHRRSESRPAALLRCIPRIERAIDAADQTSDETISVTTRPQPPCRFTRRRNAVSVMPAIGATTNGERQFDRADLHQSRVIVSRPVSTGAHPPRRLRR